MEGAKIKMGFFAMKISLQTLISSNHIFEDGIDSGTKDCRLWRCSNGILVCAAPNATNTGLIFFRWQGGYRCGDLYRRMCTWPPGRLKERELIEAVKSR